MAEDWLGQLGEIAPYLFGSGTLGVTALAWLRAGRQVGRLEERLETHSRDIESLKTRADRAEAAAADYAARLAEVPRREEMRALFAEAREATRADIGELREDFRNLMRGA